MMQKRSQMGSSEHTESALFNDQRKRQLIEALHAIAQADGRVVVEELDEIKSIAAELGVDYAD